jgi:putative protease
VQGRQIDIGAFDTPKNPGQAIGYITKVNADSVELELMDRSKALSNGDGLCYYDLQKELVGLAINRAEAISAAKGLWRVFPKDPMSGFKDLRKGVEVNRNRDMNWTRTLDKKSSDRRIGVWAVLAEMHEGIALTLTDEDGYTATARTTLPREMAKDAATAIDTLKDNVRKMGTTIFMAIDVQVQFSQPWFVPASVLNPLRREAVEALERARAEGFVRLAPGVAVEPPVAYPEDTLSYLANVFNQAAHGFYAKHGVKVIAPAYEAVEELGEVSLMITKHCVRFSLSLCPKQAKGVTGVQGQVKAEPLQLINGKEKLTLRFDCKPCEMHVVGKMKTSVANQSRKELLEAARGVPMTFHKTRPRQEFGH